VAFIPVVNTAKIDIQWSVGAKQMNTIVHAQKAAPSPFNAADLAALAEVVETSIEGHLLGTLASDIALKAVVCTALDTNTSPQATVISGVAGTDGSPMVPAGVAMCITLYTALRGRSFRGRVYIPGLPITAILVGGLWDPTFVGNVNGDFGSIIADMLAAAQSTVMGVVSYRTGGAPRAAGVFTAISSHAVRNTVPRYQRRREQDHHGRLR
jgi:hypothetical protein